MKVSLSVNMGCADVCCFPFYHSRSTIICSKAEKGKMFHPLFPAIVYFVTIISIQKSLIISVSGHSYVKQYTGWQRKRLF